MFAFESGGIETLHFMTGNYEYSNGDDHVTDFREPADYVMTVPVVLLIALRTGAAHSAVCYQS
jgi:hypothetical protein